MALCPPSDVLSFRGAGDRIIIASKALKESRKCGIFLVPNVYMSPVVVLVKNGTNLAECSRNDQMRDQFVLGALDFNFKYQLFTYILRIGSGLAFVLPQASLPHQQHHRPTHTSARKPFFLDAPGTNLDKPGCFRKPRHHSVTQFRLLCGYDQKYVRFWVVLSNPILFFGEEAASPRSVGLTLASVRAAAPIKKLPRGMPRLVARGGKAFGGL